jgi:hypothetical protein
MHVFLERFVLAVLAGAFLALLLTNPMEFGVPTRFVTGALIIFSAIGVGFFITKRNRPGAALVGSAMPAPPKPVALPLLPEPAPLQNQSKPVTMRAAKGGIEIDVEYLWNLFEAHTAINANKLLKPYIGAIVEVSGKIHNVDGGNSPCVTIHAGYSKLVFLYFSATEEDHLAMLRVGDILSAKGKIEVINQISIRLRECHLRLLNR